LGAQFIIQADFLTSANRQLVDEGDDWNKIITDAIPLAIESAIGNFNDDEGNFELDGLVNWWPLYLNHNTSGLSAYWLNITENIKKHLSKALIIKDLDGNARKPKRLMFLNWAHDRDGKPIFGDTCDYIS